MELEGTLKPEELAYILAESLAGGELKHGPIALIDQGQPVLCVKPPPATPRWDAAIQEVKARGARTICLAGEG